MKDRATFQNTKKKNTRLTNKRKAEPDNTGTAAPSLFLSNDNLKSCFIVILFSLQNSVYNGNADRIDICKDIVVVYDCTLDLS